MARFLELRRHTDNDGDFLSAEGIAAALALGRRLAGGYAGIWTSGAQRATQTAACMLAALGEPVRMGVIVAPGLRSRREDAWRAAYRAAGAGDLAALGAVAPALVAEDGRLLGEALRSILDQLGEGERGLAIGHSPTNEAGVRGLTGVVVPPLGKGEGVLITASADGYAVDELD